MAPRYFLLALSCLVSVSCSTFQRSPTTWNSNAAQVAELNALNQTLTNAYLHEDVPTLRRMLSDQHVHNNVFGMPLDKDTFLKDIETGVLKFTRYETPQVRWYVRGGMAVGTGMIEAHAQRGGKAVPATKFLFTRIFVKEKGQWKVLLFHNTMAAPPKRP